MKKILQGISSITLGALFALFLTTILVLHPQPNIPYSYKTTSNHYSVSDKQAIKRSVNSALRVVSIDVGAGAISSLTGTYFTYGGRYYVLTSAHGIIGACENILVMHNEESRPCQKILVFDEDSDYAIFQIGEIEDRHAIRIPRSLANWKKSYNLLDRTYYTGYPNGTGPTTWTGNISGFTGDYVIIQSYAWSGASGSGVFDEKGDLIGIIMAIDVGSNEFGYQVLNNFIVVVPIWLIDFSVLKE